MSVFPCYSNASFARLAITQAVTKSQVTHDQVCLCSFSNKDKPNNEDN
jgi:hypothetical protein